MSYEDERGGSGWGVAGIVIALALALVVLVGGCAAVGGLFPMAKVARPESVPPTVTREEVPSEELPPAGGGTGEQR